MRFYHPAFRARQKALRRRAILLIMALLGAFGGGLWCGQYLLTGKMEGAMARRTTLSEELQRLEEENEAYQQKIAFLESLSKVDRLAVKDTQDTLAALQKELLESKRELDFYKRIISPKTRHEGIAIQDFRLTQAPDGFLYRIILSQGIGNDKIVKGKVQLLIEGSSHDVPQVLKGREVEATSDSRFEFRYFQSLSGKLSLPEGFTPAAVEVRLMPETKGLKAVSKKWLWSTLES